MAFLLFLRTLDIASSIDVRRLRDDDGYRLSIVKALAKAGSRPNRTVRADQGLEASTARA